MSRPPVASDGGVAARLARIWRALAAEQRLAGLAALALVVSLVLPWYQKSYVPGGSREFVTQSLTALGAFSWVEAAILLVVAAVLVLLGARAEGRPFHLPGGDGTVVLAAGAWCALLLVWRMFDRPDVEGSAAAAATVGIQWGLFCALGAAVVLAAAGARMRAAHRAEPPLPGDPGWIDFPPPPPREPPAPRPPRARRPRAAGGADAEPTRVLGEPPPAWEGEPPPGPAERRRPGRRDRPPPGGPDAPTEPL